MIINRGNQLSSHSPKKYLISLKGSKIQFNSLFQTISAVLPIFSMCLANRQVLVKHSIDKNMESRYPLLIFSNARQIIHRRCSSAHEHLPASLVRSNPQFVVEYLLPRRLLNYRETFRPQFALIFPHIEPVFREPSFSSTSASPLSVCLTAAVDKTSFQFALVPETHAPKLPFAVWSRNQSGSERWKAKVDR